MFSLADKLRYVRIALLHLHLVADQPYAST